MIDIFSLIFFIYKDIFYVNQHFCIEDMIPSEKSSYFLPNHDHNDEDLPL